MSALFFLLFKQIDNLVFYTFIYFCLSVTLATGDISVLNQTWNMNHILNKINSTKLLARGRRLCCSLNDAGTRTASGSRWIFGNVFWRLKYTWKTSAFKGLCDKPVNKVKTNEHSTTCYFGEKKKLYINGQNCPLSKAKGNGSWI